MAKKMNCGFGCGFSSTDEADFEIQKGGRVTVCTNCADNWRRPEAREARESEMMYGTMAAERKLAAAADAHEDAERESGIVTAVIVEDGEQEAPRHIDEDPMPTALNTEIETFLSGITPVARLALGFKGLARMRAGETTSHCAICGRLGEPRHPMLRMEGVKDMLHGGHQHPTDGWLPFLRPTRRYRVNARGERKMACRNREACRTVCGSARRWRRAFAG